MIWHNPTRKSAKSLRGRGQAMAAAIRYAPSSEQQSAPVAIRVTGISPRKVRYPGRDSNTTEKRAGGGSDISLCEVLSVMSVVMSISTVLIYDLLTLGSKTFGKTTGLSRRHLASIAPAVLMSLIMSLALLVSIISSSYLSYFCLQHGR
ncbi:MULTISPECIES: hypothetical protein [Candidatus Ichthyocystis]|uniref:hypothetical protein n=2 Tax=Burkholderiales genera incertae sedis TaxID=224471 RepID=UPI000B882CF1|nr:MULTISPECIES: hypothetical protein [Ichthyocystis]